MHTLPPLEDGTFRFDRAGSSIYSVFTDIASGTMEYVGSVEKVAWSAKQKWQARRGSKIVGYGATRIEAAKALT